MVCQGTKKWATFPLELVPRLVTHLKHLHTFIAAVSPFVSQQNKDSSIDDMKLASTRYIGIIHYLGTQIFISSETCKNLGLLVELEFSCGC